MEANRAVLVRVITLIGIRLVDGEEEPVEQVEDLDEVEVSGVVPKEEDNDKCPEEGLLLGSNSTPNTINNTNRHVAIYATDLSTMPMSAGKPNSLIQASKEIGDSVPKDVGVEDPISVWQLFTWIPHKMRKWPKLMSTYSLTLLLAQGRETRCASFGLLAK